MFDGLRNAIGDALDDRSPGAAFSPRRIAAGNQPGPSLRRDARSTFQRFATQACATDYQSGTGTRQHFGRLTDRRRTQADGSRGRDGLRHLGTVRPGDIGRHDQGGDAARTALRFSNRQRRIA